jgi:hypothetical protein
MPLAAGAAMTLLVQPLLVAEQTASKVQACPSTSFA